MKTSFTLCFATLASLLFVASCEEHNSSDAVSSDRLVVEAESSSGKTKPGQSGSSGANSQNTEQFRFDSSGYSANVGQWSGVTLVLKGGTSPFTWSSDGNCGYLQSAKTTERKNSFVVSQWLSGETSVTVKATDAKGEKASCQLRLIPNVTAH